MSDKFVYLVLYVCTLCLTVSANDDRIDYDNPIRTQEEDLIKDLPGINFPVNFRQYSGYLNADDSDKPSIFLHYWFTESQNNPSNDPVLLWLNGGPGCSSLGGLFGELGPFYVKNRSQLGLRKYPWNMKANVIFLESPSRVGFSYSKEDLELNDDKTAKQNHLALKSFMQKFPQYNGRPLYISGESYGGVYLPTLGVLLDEDKSFNFKGVAIGNGFFNIDLLGITSIFYAYYHGLFGKSTWKYVSDSCCNGSTPTYEGCDYTDDICIRALNTALSKFGTGLNPYNYIADCLEPSEFKAFKMMSNDTRFNSRTRFARALMNISSNFSRSQTRMKFDARGGNIQANSDAPCFDDTELIHYLDRVDVQNALHIPSELKYWYGPCADVNYWMQYPNTREGLAPQMQKLIDSPRKLRILIYNGDLDMVCNFFGDELFSDNLGRKVLREYQQWRLNGQVGGYFKTYDGFTFATVKGAGHMVPSDREAEALEMITRWLLK